MIIAYSATPISEAHHTRHVIYPFMSNCNHNVKIPDMLTTRVGARKQLISAIKKLSSVGISW